MRLPSLYIISNAPLSANCFESLINSIGLPFFLQWRAKNLSKDVFFSTYHKYAALASFYGVDLFVNHPRCIDFTENFGWHFSSSVLNFYMKTQFSLPLLRPKISVSCHQLMDIELANKIGADMILLSPIRPTLTHPGEACLGWAMAEKMIKLAQCPVYCLGGMMLSDLKKARSIGAVGIAGIGMFSQFLDNS